MLKGIFTDFKQNYQNYQRHPPKKPSVWTLSEVEKPGGKERIEAAVSSGDIEALIVLGDYYCTTGRNFVDGRKCYCVAAQHNSTEAFFRLAKLHLMDAKEEKDAMFHAVRTIRYLALIENRKDRKNLKAQWPDNGYSKNENDNRFIFEYSKLTLAAGEVVDEGDPAKKRQRLGQLSKEIGKLLKANPENYSNFIKFLAQDVQWLNENDKNFVDDSLRQRVKDRLLLCINVMIAISKQKLKQFAPKEKIQPAESKGSVEKAKIEKNIQLLMKLKQQLILPVSPIEALPGQLHQFLFRFFKGDEETKVLPYISPKMIFPLSPSYFAFVKLILIRFGRQISKYGEEKVFAQEPENRVLLRALLQVYDAEVSNLQNKFQKLRPEQLEKIRPLVAEDESPKETQKLAGKIRNNPQYLINRFDDLVKSMTAELWARYKGLRENFAVEEGRAVDLDCACSNIPFPYVGDFLVWTEAQVLLFQAIPWLDAKVQIDLFMVRHALLMNRIWAHDVEGIKEILSWNKIDPNFSYWLSGPPHIVYFPSPLFLAVQARELDVVKLIVEAGVHPDEHGFKIKRGITPLMKAVVLDQREIALYLLEKGADPKYSCEFWDGEDDENLTPLEYARQNNTEMFKLLNQSLPAERRLSM